MKNQGDTTLIKWLLIICVMLLSGCTKSFDIRPVSVPYNVFPSSDNMETQYLALHDARTEADKPLNIGTLTVELRHMGNELDYLGENISRVLKAEGINVLYNNAPQANIKLSVLKFRIRNLRTSGFSPYHTFTTFSADLIHNGETKRITSYFKNSKTPVWTFREVERPCYQVPVEVVVKEIAAKLNRYIFKRVTPSEQVKKLAASINLEIADAASEQYLKVLELGYTNNPVAIELLLPLTKHRETIMREAAISALGMLGANEQFELLKKIYDTKEKIDKTMALKSIGDLDTPEARAFLDQVKMSEAYKEDETIREVADLYP